MQVWQNDKERRGVNASYVWNKQQLDTIDVNRTDYLLGNETFTLCPSLSAAEMKCSKLHGLCHTDDMISSGGDSPLLYC